MRKMDGAFFDREGVSLLGYAVCANNLKVAKYILDEISKNFEGQCSGETTSNRVSYL